MKILVLTSRFPFPLEKGDKLRIYHQLKVLSIYHEVVLIALTDQYPSEKEIEKVEKIVSELHILKINKTKRFINLIKGVFTDAPFRNMYFYNTHIKQQIDKLVRNINPDHIHCHLIRMADYITHQPLPKSLDYMDAFSDGLKKRFQSESFLKRFFYKWEWRKTLKYEEQVFNYFDYHMIISSQDQDLIPVKEKNQIVIVPNGIDTSYFQKDIKVKTYDLLFVGNLGYYPNVHAAKYIVDKILPIVPEEKLLLAGARPTKEVYALANDRVTIIPWLDDIREAYASASIFIAPLFVGIGQQNKILEAMSMGIPCVTTEMVNNAIGAEPGREILIANNESEFAEQIERLKSDSDLYRDIAVNAREFVVNNCSWETATQPFLNLLST